MKLEADRRFVRRPLTVSSLVPIWGLVRAQMADTEDALDAALVRLEAISPELARIVELRFFVGLNIDEIATVTDQSESTVKRRWKAARLWLASELTAE